MSMTVGESNAVFTLLAYLCPTRLKDDPASEAEALRAAVTLAESAHRSLSAGPTGTDIARAWRKHKPAPSTKP